MPSKRVEKNHAAGLKKLAAHLRETIYGPPASPGKFNCDHYWNLLPDCRLKCRKCGDVTRTVSCQRPLPI